MHARDTGCGAKRIGDDVLPRRYLSCDPFALCDVATNVFPEGKAMTRMRRWEYVILAFNHEEVLTPKYECIAFVGGEERAYSERCRSPFRGDGDRDSELMPITIPR